jgi:small GTP-binding protein
MSKDLEIIKELEKKLGKRLINLDIKKFYGGLNGFVTDKKERIIGLNLYYLEISDISGIQELKNLTHLNLRNNQLTNISGIQELKNLTHLNLRNNQLTGIPGIKELKNLTYLNLRDNQLTDISGIKELKNLTHLNLRNNRLTDITGIKELTNLTKLNVSDNQISHLPIEVAQLGIEIKWSLSFFYDNGIFLERNPMKSPPVEIVKQGTEAVLNYFKEIEGESIQLLESKLLIVGNGEVGKTTLMRKLEDNDFQVEIGKEPFTHGIKIVPWELLTCFDAKNKLNFEQVKLHLWDFGGNPIYQTTHQFFFTIRSLYLFVLEAGKEEARSFNYWLNTIKLLSDNSPVIVVINKSDIHKEHMDKTRLKEKFKNIVDFFPVSCVTEEGITELTEQIQLTLSSMSHLRDKLPKVWKQTREHLSEIKEKKDYINLKEYFKICKTSGLNEERAEFLSSYLHDLGIIIHFRQDKRLENIVILNPEWAAEAVYTLIDTREIQENKGWFAFEDLKKYWDLTKFPQGIHAELICLMEKFEICFNFLESNVYIIPELLKAESPPINFEHYKKADNLHFEYHYDFMPAGIISRFISRIYYLIKDDHFWKNGVELKFEDSRALVVSKSLKRKMRISISGSHISELLAIIRNEFEHIHQTLNLLKDKNYYEMIPCNCSTCRVSEETHPYKHELLKKLSAKGISITLCPVSMEEVPIDALLKGFEREKPRKDLLNALLAAGSLLRGIAKTIKSDEDSRNGFITLLLSVNGFIVKDQPRWRHSAAGKSRGRPDIKIEKPNGEPEAVVEAINLKDFDRLKIELHLQKLFGYDPGGLERNFIIVYSEADDFPGLWKKYLDLISEIKFEYQMSGSIREEKLGLKGIKSARTIHKREEKITEVYHLLINMKH